MIYKTLSLLAISINFLNVCKQNFIFSQKINQYNQMNYYIFKISMKKILKLANEINFLF